MTRVSGNMPLGKGSPQKKPREKNLSKNAPEKLPSEKMSPRKNCTP